jgi:hypothetical protein
MEIDVVDVEAYLSLSTCSIHTTRFVLADTLPL